MVHPTMWYPVTLRLSSLFATLLVTSGCVTDVDYYGSLIKNVHGEHNSAGVILVVGTNQLAFENIGRWYEINWMLFRGEIGTTILSLSQLESTVKIRMQETYIPLIVVNVDNFETLDALKSITKNVDMGYATWLIVFIYNADQDICPFCHNLQTNIFHLKFNSKIFISCCKSKIIEEWWSVYKKYIKRQEVGRLVNASLEIRWHCKAILHDYRYSMDGLGLRVAAITTYHEIIENNRDITGFPRDVLDELSRVMNFTISKKIWEHIPGIFDSKIGSWNGAIGRIHRDEADIAIDVVALTVERARAVRFLMPTASGRFVLHFRKLDAAHLMWNANFKVFNMNVWVALIALILSTSLLLTLITRNNRNYPFVLDFFDHLIDIWSIFCQQGVSDSLAKLSVKVIYISLLISSLIISNAYSAKIISMLAISSSYSPFATISEFVEDGTYSLIVLNASIAYEDIRRGKGATRLKMASLMRPMKYLPLTFKEAYIQVCNGDVAFYCNEDRIKPTVTFANCEIASVETGKLLTGAMFVPHDSEFASLFDYHISHLKTSGVLNRLERKYYPLPRQHMASYSAVSVQGILPIALTLLFGVVIALVIFLVEDKVSSGIKLHKKRLAAKIYGKSSMRGA